MLTDAQDRCFVAVPGTPSECYKVVREICKQLNLEDENLVMIDVMKDCTIVDVTGGPLTEKAISWYLTSRMVKQHDLKMLGVIYNDAGESHVTHSKPFYDHFVVYGNNDKDEEIDVCGNGYSFTSVGEYGMVARLFMNE